MVQDCRSTPQRKDYQKHFLNMVKLLKVSVLFICYGINSLSTLLKAEASRKIQSIRAYHLLFLFRPATIVMDRVSDRSKGFGFVTFASEDEAHKAITEMNGKVSPCFDFPIRHF